MSNISDNIKEAIGVLCDARKSAKEAIPGLDKVMIDLRKILETVIKDEKAAAVVYSNEEIKRAAWKRGSTPFDPGRFWGYDDCKDEIFEIINSRNGELGSLNVSGSRCDQFYFPIQNIKKEQLPPVPRKLCEKDITKCLCGGVAVVKAESGHFGHFPRESTWTSYRVACRSCGLSGAESGYKSDAIRGWNTTIAINRERKETS